MLLENAGTAAWRPDPPHRIEASYHWLDAQGNPIVWEGYWKPLQRVVEPGEQIELDMEVRAPIPPGRYRIAFDLVEEGRWWFAEVGNTPLDIEIIVAPRIERALSVSVRPGAPELEEATRRALAAQEEAVVEDGSAVAHLAAGCVPAPDWSRRVLDAHAEGYAVVGGSIEAERGLLRRRGTALAPWATGRGRNPTFAHPLLCPSIVAGVEAAWIDDVEGLPASAPPEREPWLYDGRITVRAPRPAARRRG